ncbi:MAG: 23S rRNA pseudouridine(955/2504/2580) synthase RluC [Gammaproteobacteria bacterium]|nr:23S rRNA pseudouridine(955/2504/2580) synthase RluC [Gammaproteobacteria bacterium]
MSQSGEKSQQSGVQLVEISADLAGQRVDNFLLNRLKGAPRSLIYRILRRGEVRVNKGRIRPQYRLKAGDTLRIPPVRLAPRSTPPRPAEQVLRQLENAILYEDNRLLILNKPSGLAVHGGSGLSYGVIEGLRALRPQAPYLELVHRLDRDTSGCLLIAKKRSALRRLHELLRNNGIDKRYLALLKGQWRGGSRQIDAPLRKNVLRSGERIVRVDPEGKSALSVFRPLAVGKTASLVEVKLETGRTHQVRVHAASVGQPIAGDDKYGDDGFNRQLREAGLKRLFLHACSLRFQLIEGEPAIEVTAPLDDELEQVLRKLELKYERE